MAAETQVLTQTRSVTSPEQRGVVLPGRCVHIIFRERARQAPDRIALSTPEESVSYGELDARSDRLAGHLVKLGVRPDVLVGLCARRSPDAIVGMLGILKAGGAYVPIDPGYPAERIDYLLADCAAPLVVAAWDTSEVIGGRHPAVVWIHHGEGAGGPGASGLDHGVPPAETAA